MCDCGNTQSFEECCGPYLKGLTWPDTAEKLMRSRYTAFARGDIRYIGKTLIGKAAKDFNEKETLDWSKTSQWLGLEILKTEKGQLSDETGTVEFVAKYKQQGQVLEHHEVSKFKKDSHGHWMFMDGDSHVHEEGQGHHHHSPVQQLIREEPKIGRNDPCHCGSGKKFKKCHGS